jgi:putative two-component system response regulator
MSGSARGCILVVDDDTLVLESVCALLAAGGFDAVPCAQSTAATRALQEYDVQAVLSDIKMPGLTGTELLAMIHEADPGMPVVLMTGYAEFELAMDAVRNGAFDLILKPFKPDYLALTLKRAVDFRRLLLLEKNYKTTLEGTVLTRTQELADALGMVRSLTEEVVRRLTTVTEFRDSDTGAHVARIGLYTRLIAEAMSMPADFVETISFASPMHDIGKVVVPDSILLKPGPLSQEEYEVMKTHTVIGEKILSGSRHPSLQMAAAIALSHHERQDGSGYPRGTAGDAIPLEARITMLCDQYDALTSRRPYKDALPHADAVRIICVGDGRTLPRHFHPDVLRAFVAAADRMERIRARLDT